MPATLTLRRLLMLIALACVATVAATRLRGRGTSLLPAEPPVWPPLPEPAPPAGATFGAPSADTWAPPTGDGACPPGFPVKAKSTSSIYHLPGGSFYERTTPDRCYPDAASAEADGYRRSKS